MASNVQIGIRIRGDSTGAVKGFALAGRAAGDYERRLDDVNRTGRISASVAKQQAAEFLNFRNIIAGISVGGLAVVTRNIIQADAELGKLSQAFGVSSEALSTWQFAARSAGIDASKVGDVFKDLSDKLGDLSATGGGEAKDVFEKLGLDIQQLIDLSPDQQLLKIADALDTVQSRSEKIFLLESLADDASRLLPLLEDGAAGFKELQREAEELGVVIGTDQVRAAQKAERAVDRLSASFSGMIRNLLSGGALDSVVGMVDDIGETFKDPGVQQGIATVSRELSSLVTTIVENAPTVLKVLAAIAGAKVGGALGSIAGPKGRIAGGLIGAGIGLSLADIEEEVARADTIRTKIQELESTLKKTSGVSTRAGINERLGSLRAELRGIEEAARLAGESVRTVILPPIEVEGVNPPTGTTGSTGRPGPLSEVDKEARALESAFESHQDSLRQQIILYGETSEAARLRYEFEFGALQNLSQQQQNELMILAKTRDLQVAQGDAAVEAARKQQDVQAAINQRMQETQLFMGAVGRSFSSAFEGAILQGRKFSDVLRGLAQDLVQLAARKLVLNQIESAFAASNPYAAAGSFVKGLFAHQGGVIGVDALPSRQVPALAFAGATRYHNGGLAGDEVPAVLRRGEEVLTRQDPRHRNNQSGGGQGITIHNHLNIDARNADGRTVKDLEAVSLQIAERAASMTESRIMGKIERGGPWSRAVGRRM